jgi:short-subunit dehydrogenase
MIATGHGRILNITSNAGVYRWPLVSAYATSKAALVKLTEKPRRRDQAARRVGTQR